MIQTIEAPAVDLASLREAIQNEYALVAEDPTHGFHFLVGRPLAELLGYEAAWLPTSTYVRDSANRCLFDDYMMTPSGFLHDEGVKNGLEVMARALSRLCYVRKMAWLVPRIARALPYLGFILIDGTKPISAEAT